MPPNYSELVTKTRAVFQSGRTKANTWRREQLMAMLRLLEEQEQQLCDVLQKDLRKHRNESMVMEVGFVKNDLIDTINNLDAWTKPEKVGRNLMTLTDSAYIQREPYGVVLIMGAWNYPVQLTLMPMIGALSAGNCVILKPSEVSPATAQLLEKLIPQYFDQDCVKVVNGAVEETTALLKERFDYIFYTGNSMVGKIISEAAAKYLTPVTLELGGKSPFYIHPDSDLDLVSRRLIWGKFTNAGQTCIAPDYVMCNKDVQGLLLERLRNNLENFYGNNIQSSDGLGRIVNDRHFNRVKNLLSGANIAIGGKTDEKDLYIEPTVVTGLKPTDPLMRDEVFGPVLPVMTVENEDEAISFINSREKPLAMYVYSKSQKVINKFVQQTSSGSFCANDCLMQSSLPTLPFGGVGNSGCGAYHGKFTFETFSHHRSVLVRAQNLEKINDLRYPPYTERKQQVINWVLGGKKVKSQGSWIGSLFPVVIIGIIIGFLLKMAGFQGRAAVGN